MGQLLGFQLTQCPSQTVGQTKLQQNNIAKNSDKRETQEKHVSKKKIKPTKPFSPQRLFQQKILWLDSNENGKQQKKLQYQLQILKKKTLQECLQFLRQFGVLDHIPVICAGSIAKDFLTEVKKCKQIYNVQNVFIFCRNVEKYKYLLENQLVKCVQNDTEALLAAIKLSSWSYQLPNFRKFADDKQKCVQLKYSYFLAYLTLPVLDVPTRQKMIKKFNSAVQRYSKIDFHYPLQLDQAKIIKLYIEDQIYKYLNCLLKTNILKHLENGHIMIADLHLVINQLSAFEYRCKVPSVLYRGCTLTKDQLDEMPQYLGSQIQFLSFLSTSKELSVAKKYFRRNNTLITIYIPKFFKDKQSQKLIIRGGYIDVEKFIIPKYDEKEVIFNIKTKMTMIRMQSRAKNINDIQLVHEVELVYGLDQIICRLDQNPRWFYVHSERPNDLKQLLDYCVNNCDSKLHFIGASSKKIKCLKDLTQNDLLVESFILMNDNTCVNGMVIQYDQDAQKSLADNRKQFQGFSPLCEQCKAKVQCQFCADKELCLCRLQNHDADHLQKCHILVESEIPRFISTDLNQARLNMYRTHEQIQQKIKCEADAMLMTKDEKFMVEAEKLYDAEINSQEFKQLEYTVQYDRLFYRGESIRLRKYIQKDPVTEQQYEKSLDDYRKCYELVKDKPNEFIRQSIALLHTGIVEDDLKRYEIALARYNESFKILQQQPGELTNDIKTIKVKIINCQGFIYMHLNQYEKAANLYRNALINLRQVKGNNVQQQAKILNNLTCCLNKSKKYKEAVVTGQKSYNLRLCIFGSGNSLTKNSLANYLHAKGALKKQ